ncbi:MAG TPA: hypothetical protein VIF62_05830, partial [Labilithrix sp.]
MKWKILPVLALSALAACTASTQDPTDDSSTQESAFTGLGNGHFRPSREPLPPPSTIIACITGTDTDQVLLNNVQAGAGPSGDDVVAGRMLPGFAF